MLRDLIPAKYRRAVYSVLGTVIALEGIFDLVPEGAQTKILQALRGTLAQLHVKTSLRALELELARQVRLLLEHGILF
jgi:hypothetical protein